MIILSHRGYWKAPAEQNTPAAFERSFHLGFGTETDVRDLDRLLVVSHDPPTRAAHLFDELLAQHGRLGPMLPLALNIKADGLQPMLRDALRRRPVHDVFFFDMAIPDLLVYAAAGLPFFTRQSEHELAPVLYAKAAGVWLDGFRSDWYDDRVLLDHLGNGKRVCVVSPELHRRPHEACWSRLRALRGPGLMLCTDFPEEAKEFFRA